MGSHGKKMVAPVVVTVLMVLYFILYFGLLINMLNGIWKYAFGIIPLIFVVVMIKVCVERIKEINKGEEDDLSKY